MLNVIVFDPVCHWGRVLLLIGALHDGAQITKNNLIGVWTVF
jgi:hypothetical protein